MPIRFRVSSAHALAVVIFEGVVTLDEFQRQAAPLVETPEYNLLRLTLVDTTGATRADAPSEVVVRHARRAAHNIDEKIGDTAILAVSAPKHSKQPQTPASNCPQYWGRSMAFLDVSAKSWQNPFRVVTNPTSRCRAAHWEAG